MGKKIMMDLKFVFTVSLVAVMVVTAANADIASTTYYTGDADVAGKTPDSAKTNAINVTLDTAAQKAVITAKQATASQKGVMLLYGGTGSNTAGTMTQKAITDALAAKQDAATAVKHTANTAVGGVTRPVYVASNGQATAVTGTSVPVGAATATSSTTWASIWIEE